jgi:hypothetical protein
MITALAYKYDRLSFDTPDFLQCAELDVNGLFEIAGSYTSSYNVFMNYDCCVRPENSNPINGEELSKSRAVRFLGESSYIEEVGLEEYSSSYKYFFQEFNYSTTGFETGFVFHRKFPSYSPVVTALNGIGSGFAFEAEGWQGSSLIFRLKDGSLGSYWFGHNATDPNPAFNMTGDHGFDVYNRIYGVDKDCYRNSWVVAQNETENSETSSDSHTMFEDPSSSSNSHSTVRDVSLFISLPTVLLVLYVLFM